MRRIRAMLCVMMTASLLTLWPGAAGATTWQRVSTGITGGISGLAPGSSGWVLVRDNKNSGQNRISLLSSSGSLTPLSWPGTAPQDLESVAAVPGRAGQYAALTSTGRGTIIRISGSTVTKIRSFTVPRGTSDIEGLALTGVGSTTVAVWARRGSTSTPASVYAATFDVTNGTFGQVASGTVRVPYPTSSVRHVSDLTIVGSRLRGAAASDPGDNGPFTSALYDMGTVGVSGGRASLSLTSPQSLGQFPGHKIEGIACSGTTGLLGSDDENQGGWIASSTFCG